MSKGPWPKRGFKWGPKVDADLTGADTFRNGYDIYDVYPNHCWLKRTKPDSTDCLNCHLHGKMQCAPMSRVKVKV